MSKPIFLKAVSSDDNAPILVALPNQKHTINGKEIPIQTNMMCVTRDTSLDFQEGEIYATDQLSPYKNNWYTVGVDFYQLTNENGLIFSGGVDDPFKNDLHKQWTYDYRNFLDGKEYGTGELPDGKFTAKSSRKVLTYMEKLQRDKALQPPTIEDDGWYVDKDTWWYLIRNLTKRKNTLMIGKSGAGKSELVMMMAKKVGKNLSIFDMAVSNPNKAFCGNLRAENGSTFFQYARFAKEIQNDGLILMDELSRAAPSANNIFLPVLDGRRTLYIEDAITESEIKVNEDCLFWATANIGAEFIGTSQLDHALMNRFNQIAIHYPPEKEEARLLEARFGLSSYDAEAITKVANIIRNTEELSKDVSTRQLFEVADLIADGYSKIDAFRWSVLQQFEGNDVDGGERATVMSILQSM